MLTNETIRKLKQVNVSKDADKTKERVRALWKPLDKPRRAEILNVSGLKQITVERAYTNGSIQAKLIVAFAYVLEADPLYLTGEADVQRDFNEELVISYLTGLGYKDLKKTQSSKIVKPKEAPPEKAAAVKAKPAAEPKRAEVYADKKEETQIVQAKPAQVVNACESCSVSDFSDSLYKSLSASELKRLTELDEDDYILLLQSQFIKAEFDAEKSGRLTLVKYLLLQ